MANLNNAIIRLDNNNTTKEAKGPETPLNWDFGVSKCFVSNMEETLLQLESHTQNWITN